jgi:hypothetical protein
VKLTGLRPAAYAPVGRPTLFILPELSWRSRTWFALACTSISSQSTGTSLPDEVYANLDFEAVVAAIGAAAGDNSYRGLWQGPQETGMFFFGADAEAMFARVEPVLR